MRLGFDVGGTKTDAVIVAPAGAAGRLTAVGLSGAGANGGEILARVRLPTGWGAHAVIATIVRAADDLLGQVGATRADLTSIGVGMPGQVADGTARVAHAVNLGIDELDVAAALGPEFGVPVRAENDVKAAALGAYALHRGGEGGSMAYLNVGTGIAAGFVTDGVLWRGERGTAGEVGHISIDPNGPLCPCGQRGCIEAFSGGGAVARRWGRPGALPVRDVFDAADAGDARAAELRRDLARGIAAAVRVLVLTADIRSVVLGGGVTALGDRMLRPVVSELEASAAASAFLRSLRVADRLDLLPQESPAAAFGASVIGGATQEQEAVAHG